MAAGFKASGKVLLTKTIQEILQGKVLRNSLQELEIFQGAKLKLEPRRL
jgi:hypothetical protein